MQKILSKKKSVTIPEAGILWEASPNTIFKMLNKGLLVGYHPFGTKHTRIDVAKSNAILEK
ncbi:MAG: hypothetical protein H9W80_12355 [Enterococcus sp.]|nr:hypothetical protein [Enterococcus sp.]